MSDQLIGPNPCWSCGGEYGEHYEGCETLLRQHPTKMKTKSATCFKSESVWMLDNNTSVARAIAVEAMLAVGNNPANWRVRDEVIMAISELVNSSLDAARDEALREALELHQKYPPSEHYECTQAILSLISTKETK